jgi:transposase
MKKPPLFEREALEQMTVPALVDIILQQQEAIQYLFEEIERLKLIINKDSRNSSKPPSGDLIKRSEKAKIDPERREQKETRWTTRPSGYNPQGIW